MHEGGLSRHESEWKALLVQIRNNICPKADYSNVIEWMESLKAEELMRWTAFGSIPFNSAIRVRFVTPSEIHLVI